MASKRAIRALEQMAEPEPGYKPSMILYGLSDAPDVFYRFEHELLKVRAGEHVEPVSELELKQLQEKHIIMRIVLDVAGFE